MDLGLGFGKIGTKVHYLLNTIPYCLPLEQTVQFGFDFINDKIGIV